MRPRLVEVGPTGELRDFQGRQIAGKNCEIADLATLKACIAKTIAERQIGFGISVSNIFKEPVADNFAGYQRAVEPNLGTSSAAGAIIRNREVRPSISWQRGFANDF